MKQKVKPIRPTVVNLATDDYDEFNRYAKSTEKTKSVGMDRMREMMKQHKSSKLQVANEYDYIKLSDKPQLKYTHSTDGAKYSSPYDLEVRLVNNGIAIKTDFDVDIVFTFDEIESLYKFKEESMNVNNTGRKVTYANWLEIQNGIYYINNTETEKEIMKRVQSELKNHVRSKKRR
ncbi:hypothetical protein IAQ67_16515 [Paenibacillus peoriae]|uniref:Uncharacterized protein n=1 Tax=Paenibacillus peoriae TaxID=59893 RepID=A0A7H0Y331_9BACL|nr:hypothetical protein [Paenibacillus peoriae]QNR65489.1 hypothetical protein IAQ67_16515 [Paenibacillus peoriae]